MEDVTNQKAYLGKISQFLVWQLEADHPSSTLSAPFNSNVLRFMNTVLDPCHHSKVFVDFLLFIDSCIYTDWNHVFSLVIFMTNISFKTPLATSEAMVSCLIFNLLPYQIHPKWSPIGSSLNFSGSNSGLLWMILLYHFSLFFFYCF